MPTGIVNLFVLLIYLYISIITQPIKVSVNDGDWHSMIVEMRGPFLIWYEKGVNPEEDPQQVSKQSVIGYDIIEDERGIIKIQFDSHKSVKLDTEGNTQTFPTSKDWATTIRKAARQDAKRSGQAQDSAYQNHEERYSINDISLMELIGKGTYGEVWKATLTSNGTTSLSAVKISHQQQERTVEQSLLMKMDCPYVVRADGVFTHEGRSYIVMPLLEGGDLDLHLDLTPHGYFTADRSRFHAAEILCALDYLHSKGVVYRDLKPENVVLDVKGHTVLTDMGHARSLSNTARAETFCGTAEYLAPEILSCDGHNHAVDHWALGVLMFEMITGSLPFTGSGHEGDLYEKILTTQPEFPAYADPDAHNLILSLLEKDPKRRLKSPSIKEHPFFASLNFASILDMTHPPPFVPDVELVRTMMRRKLKD